ncbi:MAG: hypothetical protein COV70_04220 [Parcubacteria group bacterium CG11_big_fil_rev_8_21_14_0_20_39_22]|nr:MAG: hypothetical protein COV70_04220 [Parcubacteria group bacterium CG11_big_fil_rev_8_21_14_0_20_39_22]
MALPRYNRVPTDLFNHILKEGKSVWGGLFSVKFSPLSGKFTLKNGSKYRVSIVVPKKVVRKATSRNYLRRRTSSLLSDILPIKEGYGVLIFLKKDLKSVKKDDLSFELSQLFKKAGLKE